MKAITNLNQLAVPVEHSHEPQRDHGISADARVEVVFRNQRARLINEIERWPIVLGCVAWLTDEPVLSALARREHVSIVVQKEDFLRPDLVGPRANRLRALYNQLPSTVARFRMPGGAGHLSYACDPHTDPVRCAGNHNRERRPAWPRMHNKFLVFCEWTAVEHHFDEMVITPRQVWTGSYNISNNAAASWENAVLIDSTEIADAFAREYSQILALSERLDWSSDWVEPEYRIGS